MIIPSKIYALCYDISQETELKRRPVLKIAIIGYSGSGKSTLANFLGQHYNCEVLHLDKIHFYTSNLARANS